jgi:hypothetical protein
MSRLPHYAGMFPERSGWEGVPCRGVKRALLVGSLLLVGTSSAAPAGNNPWQLRCSSMPTERAIPAAVQAAALKFFPWVRPAENGLRAGPVYLVALSSKTSISRDGDDTDGEGYYLHRALIAVAPSQSGTVMVTGHRLGAEGTRTALGFSTTGATNCTVKAPIVHCGWRPLRFAPSLRIARRSGWRIVPTELRIGRTGCFQLTVSGAGLRRTIPLAVPGPDYGTPGW